MNISIIGFGNMGQLLAETISRCHPDYEKNIFIYNRSPEKVHPFLETHREARLSDTADLAARNADIIFICVKPDAVHSVLSEITPVLKKEIHLISIAADVSLACINSLFKGKTTIMMPTAATMVNSGATLCCHNSLVTGSERSSLSELFTPAVKFYEVPEQEIENLSNITSCGPGLLSEILKQFAESQGQSSRISPALIREMLIDTLDGICAMIQKEYMSFDDIIKKVAAKGGITEAGNKVLSEMLPEVFSELKKTTSERHAQRKIIIQKQFDR